MLERWLENFLFASRWLLAPLFVGLALSLIVLVLKAGQTLWEIALHAFKATESEVILHLLGLVDLTLTASLIVIVIFSGYENFVSRIDPGAHTDWPEWMAKIDFAGLKLKLLSSIIAISAIQVLRAFMEVRTISDRELMWYAILHCAFIISGLFMALTDRISGEGHQGGAALEPKVEPDHRPNPHA
jgi:uncharacterized protein (TIGR00645 family)